MSVPQNTPPVTVEQDLTLAGLVHDLNNTFEIIGEAADLLSLDEKWASLAATIERAVDQGKRITASFRESAKTFELELILDNAIQSTKDFLLTSRLGHLQFKLSIEPGIRLSGQSGAWERVFLNLFLNSANVMPGGGEIEIVAARCDDGIQIDVSDNGPGIPSEILGDVFRAGFSTGPSRTGLGLAIVESIVHDRGGQVTAGNRRTGRGATISIRVPRSQIAVSG